MPDWEFETEPGRRLSWTRLHQINHLGRDIRGARTPAPIDEDAPPPKPQPVELPARFYSLLTGILRLLAFVVLIMLRR